MMEEVDSIREDMEAVFAEQAAEAPAPPQASTEALPSAQEPQDDPKTARDTSGRFAPVEPAKIDPAAEKPAEAPAEVKTETPLYDRAPASWKPAAREKWAALDPDLRAEVMRRETEMTTALNQTAQSRRLAEEFQRVVSPHLPHLQSMGGTPLEAVGNMLQTSTALRTSSPAQKASIIADVVQQFGIDVSLLDQQLTARYSGQPAVADPTHHVMQTIDARLAPIQSFMQQLEQQKHAQLAQTQQELAQELAQFAEKNEFLDDVRQDVADLLELASNRGQKMSLQEAYDKAILIHPQVSSVIAQRKTAQAATQQTEAARRAKQASASLPSRGAPSQGREEAVEDDVRSALLASMNQLSKH